MSQHSKTNKHNVMPSRKGAISKLGGAEVKLPDPSAPKIGMNTQPLAMNNHEPPEPEAHPEPPIVGTDSDNANLFVSEHGKDIRWCEPLHYWLTWDGRRWKRNNGLEVKRLADKTARALLRKSAQFPEEIARKLAGVALQLLSEGRMMSMIEASKRKVEVLETALDNDRGFLTVRNGVINLRTGALEPYEKARMSTRMTDIPFDPTAKCPQFMGFLRLIMGGNEDNIRWLLRAVGYSLTGYGDAKMFAYLYGGGDNGKSTFLETIIMLAGEYAQKSSIEALLAGQRAKEQKNTPFTAALRGARFVSTDEMMEGSILNASLMKDLTGGDKLTGMAKYQDPIEFYPSHFLWLYGNTKPTILDNSNAMWGRVKLILFGVTIPVEMRKPINEVKDMFRAELSGILNLVIEAARDAIENGIGTTETIQTETKEYQEGEDIVGRWLKEGCIQGPTYRVEKRQAYQLFHKWVENEGIQDIPQSKTLTTRLRKFGIDLGGAGRKDYIGFRLNTPGDPSELDDAQGEPM